MNEETFQEQVLELAQLYGWRSYHTFDSRRSTAGFPDLVLVRPPELLFVELKSDDGRVRVEQDAWLNDLQKVALAAATLIGAGSTYVPVRALPAIEVHLWRPRDFDAMHDRLKPRPRR
jgi:hypothetical protein